MEQQKWQDLQSDTVCTEDSMSTISILVRTELSWTRSGLVPGTVLLSASDTP